MVLARIKNLLQNVPDVKKPELTKFGRYLIYTSLILGLIASLSYLVLEADFSNLFPDKPDLILVEDFTNKPEWSLTPAILEPQYFKENGTTSYYLVPVPLSISVKNMGKKSVDVARIELEYPSVIKIYSNDEEYKNKLMTRGMIQSKTPIKIIHDLGSINPRESKRINDMDVLIFENTINMPINFTTKDGVPMSTTIQLVIAYPINYTIYTRNNEPVQGTFRITVGPRSHFIENTIPFTEINLKDNNTIEVKYNTVYNKSN